MKLRVWIAVSLLSILSILAVGFASADAEVLGRVAIPFKFMVANKEMPAGNYEIVKTEGDGQGSNLLLRNMSKGRSTYLHIIERLAQTNPEAMHKAKVVFDSVGDQKHISEFWPADNHDGYLVGVTKGEQKHVILTEP
jgi:hypothetical protein